MSAALAGPGDAATWGPCLGHPNDPRTEYADECRCDQPRPDALGYCQNCGGLVDTTDSEGGEP